MRLILPIVIAMLSAAVPALAGVDPLAPARSGELQCYSPKPEKKTCQALAGYTFGANGILNQAEVLLSPDPLVVLKTVTKVTVSNGAVCGPFRKEEIDAGTIVLNGKPLDDVRSAKVKAQLVAALATRLGKEVCTTYVASGTGFTATATLDGVADATGPQTVIWVSPSDGFRVGP